MAKSWEKWLTVGKSGKKWGKNGEKWGGNGEKFFDEVMECTSFFFIIFSQNGRWRPFWFSDFLQNR